MKKFSFKILTAALVAMLVFSNSSFAEMSNEEFTKAMEKFLENDDNVEKITVSLKRFVQNQEEKQRKQALDEQFSNPVQIDIGSSPVKGPKDAKITVVEFSDFQCPYCNRGAANIAQVLKENADVKLVFKNLPLPFHQQAKGAAIAALAAGKQGKFWEMHDKLFENQSKLSEEPWAEFAKDIGIDVEKFKKDLEDESLAKQVDEDLALAQKLGVRGTPGFFVNGVQLQGAQPPSEFNKIIEEWKKRGL